MYLQRFYGSAYQNNYDIFRQRNRGWLCCADARGPLSCPAPAGIIIDRYIYFFWKIPLSNFDKRGLRPRQKSVDGIGIYCILQPIFLPNNILTSTRPAYFNCQILLFHSIKTIGFIQWGCPFLSRFKCFKLLMNQLYGSKRIKRLFVHCTTKY